MDAAHRIISRRSFLAASALTPLAAAVDAPGEYRFSYDHVIGTSLDGIVRSRSRSSARLAEQAALAEISRLSRVLDTRIADSEIRVFESAGGATSRSLDDVLSA